MLKEKYSFSEIIALQKLPLVDKIKLAIEVIEKISALSKSNVAIAFSGGKDSQVVADLIERFAPELHARIFCIFGNTTCEFPESLRFAREYGREHYGDRFHETKPLLLERDELRYEFAKQIVAQVEAEDCLDEILKSDGKLSGQKALIAAALKRGYKLSSKNCFFAGHRMDFMYCLEQYGLPLLGKAASKLDAHRINIECFLKYSKTNSECQKLNEYYSVLKDCKLSQYCCTLLKKEPSEKLFAELNVDVTVKGLMAEESQIRKVNVSTRGHIFASSRKHAPQFYHVSPIAMWTEKDIWNYINYYNLKYSPLYDITYEDHDGNERKIERNGCMFCGTDLMFKDNQLAVLRQTHGKAYKICMEKFGYKAALNALFRRYAKKSIYQAMTPQGQTARLLFAIGDQDSFSRIRPCAYDEIGDMMELEKTGLKTEFDPEDLQSVDMFAEA